LRWSDPEWQQALNQELVLGREDFKDRRPVAGVRPT